MNISDDTALVLSPQKFNNVDPWSDIFNHYNIHFWHYIMSSLCSFDTIFCTGTNFLLRARALAEVGWFPTKSITEDFELGIYLTIRKWKYEYIYKYLAVGDAPTGIRNIYQQRSRWSKGAF
jgi:cellulose synthase/poly-beta-1,6-N-acetylglucosamine synthase-like glycosyltransferase